MNDISVSIIIVNFNTKEFTRNCINSIFKHLSNISFEIIVVDNGSSDGSVEYLQTLFTDIIIISTGENLGFGYGNNIGFCRSNGEYLLLLNSDTILIKDIITPLLNFYSVNKNLNIGVLGSLLISEDIEVLHSFGEFPYILRLRLDHYVHRNQSFVLEEIKNKYYSEVDIVSGALMFMERTVFERFNGFDTNIFLYEEEMELQFRMKKNNYISIIINEKGVVHFEGKSSSSYFKRKCSFLSLCYIMRKHLPYFLYCLFRIKWIIYSIIFFKNPKISLNEKINYLKLTILKK
jgi:GT2 family glycosyltransferase